MIHDPLCPYFPEQQGFGGIGSGVPSAQPYIAGVPCQCDLIDRVREDERFYATRDAIHTVEQMLDEYPYDSEGYRAITTAGNRLRILAGSKDD